MVRLVFASVFLLLSTMLFGQKVDAFAKISASKKEVYVEQGLKVTVTAFSSTWFAQPLSFENLQIEGAFVQSFKRTQSSIKYLDKKKYAALEFHYIIFPYKTGELFFPELIIKTSIPPEGDYKGQPTTLKTKPFSIFVKEVPNEIEKEKWLVASNINIKNSWSENLNEIKVGEVVKRQITIEANGTLPSFIDGVELKPVDFASIYPHQPEFIDERDNQSVNGKRIDTYSYLFEEEGSFLIPEVNIQWYHPVAKKLFEKSIPSFEVRVLPNPELASMQQLKDSLLALNHNQVAKTEPISANSSNINSSIKLIFIVIVFFVIGFYLIKWLLKFRQIQKEKRKIYLQSENCHFNQMMKEKNKAKFLSKIYYWLMLSQLSYDKKTLKEISKQKETFQNEAENIKAEFFHSNSSIKSKPKELKNEIRTWRQQQLLKTKSKQKKYQLKELNP